MYRTIDSEAKASNRSADLPASQTEHRRSLGRRLWNRWLKFAEIVGTVQMVIILTLVYWTIVAATAIPFKILSDPLRLKRPPGWTRRGEAVSVIDSMKNQY